jgi:Ni/Fe-hydrogenase 1 B-type cytochrome subunit
VIVATRAVGRTPPAVVVQKPGRPKMVVYVFGRYIRVAHWIRNGLLIWLVLSGIYLGNPFLATRLYAEASESFVMAQVRGWHVLAGWILLAMTLVRIYQFLFVRPDGRLGLGAELRMAPVMFSWKAWRDQLAFYLLLRRDHPHFVYSNYGPLQYLVYTVLYASLLVISITGILLAAPYLAGGLASWSAGLLRPIEVGLGGLANVRAVHRFTMWFFVVFTLVHIYMAVWNSIRTGNLLLEGIVSGFKAEDVTAGAEVRGLTEREAQALHPAARRAQPPRPTPPTEPPTTPAAPTEPPAKPRRRDGDV